MVFILQLLLPENEWISAYIFFAATMVDNLYDNPILFKTV